MIISIHKIVAVILGTSLVFGNITYLFSNIEDGFSRFTYLGLFTIFLYIIMKSRIILIHNIILFYIITFCTVMSLFNFSNLYDISNNIFKFSIISCFFIVRLNYKSFFSTFLKSYHIYYLISLLLSLIVYYFIRKPEFIFYDGSNYRFAGFHFELFNFCFSTFLFFLSFRLKFSKILSCLLLFTLFYFSKSNSYLVYLVILFFPSYDIFRNKYIFNFAGIFIVFSPLFIGLFLESLSFINLFSVRETSSFNAEGSSLFVRLYPYQIAAAYINEFPILSILPKGFGYWENHYYIKSNSLSFGGTGSTKSMIDMGLFLFSFFILTIIYKVFNNIRHSVHFKLLVKIFFSSLYYISFGAGFFNILAWGIICSLMSVKRFET